MQASVFGGRPIWFDSLRGGGVDTSVPTGYVYNETNAGFTQNRGLTNLTLDMNNVFTVGSYGDGQAFRVIGVPGARDIEILFLWTVETSNERLPGVWVRGDYNFTGAVQSRDSTCYWLEADSDSSAINLTYSSGGTGVFLTSAAVSWTLNTDTFMRFAAIGKNFYGKAWSTTAPEPRWQLVFTDTAVAGGTSFGFGLNGGASGTSDYGGLFKGFWAWNIATPQGAIAR